MSRCRLRLFATGGLAVFLLVLSLMFISCSGSQKQGEATVRIPDGSSTAEIARILEDEGIINSGRGFMNRAEELGLAASLKPGIYRFERGEPIDSIIEKLVMGLQAPEAVLTVPEGFSISDIARLLADRTGIPEAAYQEAAGVRGRVLPLGGAAEADNLEGFLFPSTYELDQDVDAETLAETQLARFVSETAAAEWGNAARLGLTQYQVLIVASMVEREAKTADERPLVAAVIYNRLSAGMKIEVDATVQYALGFWKQDLSGEDLLIDSPYNTRLYPGLPPGPICNPGIASINAALNPAPVDYLYYVATGDEEGHHFFTSSYEEFLKAQEGSGAGGE